MHALPAILAALAAWSPDGTTLAFVRTIPGDEADQAQIMLRDAAGSRAVTPLREGFEDYGPAWSPDGTTLAFARFTVQGERYRTSTRPPRSRESS